ncbi:hypothetical protein CDAR_589461 [Caerostris darwini]|uniref:Uncharacterized protein n=1 Tax=Caerostris darwini TaxID=1538125 RepID=A0AAV4T6I0_9ARAC|nr:hypothetical protein CDAR_589461 [Caerostris darwini]
MGRLPKGRKEIAIRLRGDLTAKAHLPDTIRRGKKNEDHVPPRMANERAEEAPNDVPRRSGGFLRMGTSSSRNGLLRRARASARPNRFLRALWSLGLLT